MSFEDLRAIALFDGLSDDQLLELMTGGEELRFNPGEDLFREAQPADYWWVLLEGTISLVRQVGHEESVLRVMDSPGQWAGGFRAWDANGVYLATGRGAAPGRILRVPAELLQDLANAWFPFGVHLIGGLVHSVRNIESVARQREALVALGTLAAGLAHEMNNPASAATRAVDALEDTCEALLSSLGRLAEGSISAAQFVALDTLRREIQPQSSSMEPLAVADREDALSDWLIEHGVEQDWLIAPPFAAAGLDIAWCERVAAVLDGGPLEAGLEWVASSLSTATLLSEVKESTRRISDLIAAVRSYSQLDRASMQQMDLAEGIESTLVMLAHKLQGGVTVVRDYGNDVPRIEAIAGELNQVWTNLIDNAIDAMKGTGTLRVSTRVNENGVVVEIGDTGPGMPKEVQTHAFEPFYTTKDVGKGTGLGLDISRRIIVERHGGEITIESRPDETVLRVSLPLRPTATL
ncbi:MAG: ATP-binding protein [Actinomycetota bacterium]|nr:ATP-binding protein [Actinomycetota bacterium]